MPKRLSTTTITLIGGFRLPVTTSLPLLGVISRSLSYARVINGGMWSSCDERNIPEKGPGGCMKARALDLPKVPWDGAVMDRAWGFEAGARRHSSGFLAMARVICFLILPTATTLYLCAVEVSLPFPHAQESYCISVSNIFSESSGSGGSVALHLSRLKVVQFRVSSFRKVGGSEVRADRPC